MAAEMHDDELQGTLDKAVGGLIAERDALKMLLAEARAALEPFAAVAAEWPWPWRDGHKMLVSAFCFSSVEEPEYAFLLGDLRRAAEMVAKLKGV